MRTVFARLVIAALLGSFALSAHGQGLPPGSYQQSCRDFRIEGGNLTAVCRRSHGRGERLTALNVSHCVGDIGNNNGNLVCNGGRPARPVPPPSEVQYAPGAPYPAPGYAPPPPRYGQGQGYWEHCQHLRHEEHELRDRLAYAPYGEQRERLLARLDDPAKLWKFNPADLDERAYWADYQSAYAAAIAATSTEWAPWYIVPGDAKWYRNWAISQLLYDALAGMKLSYPPADFDIEAARARLRPPF